MPTKIRLKFERVVRDCRYNKDLQDRYAGGDAPPKLIYDFKVMIYGEHRATLVKESHGYQGYTVYDTDHAPIVGASLTSGRTITRAGHPVEAIPNQKGFEARITLLLEEGKIPTLAERASNLAAKDAHERLLAAAAVERARIAVIQAAGVDLYDALMAADACIAGHSSIRYSDPLRAQIRAAIAKAEGGAS